MQAHEGPNDPGYDDWFDEPELPTETQSGANRGVYEETEEVWVMPEEEDAHSPGQREIVIAGRAFTTTQVAIIGLSLLAIILAILAAAGVFSGNKAAAPPPVTTPLKTVTETLPATTAANTTPTQGPTQTLQPGATGSQVKALQQALTTLGYSPGTADGDYGINTKVAVEKFQAAKGLAQDGVVGPATLAAIQKGLSSG
jgi:hypothetical protein